MRPWVPTRPAVYYRASTEQQEQLQTIETQRRFVRRHLEKLGFDPDTVPEYVDDGVTGTISIEARPDGARLMEDARRGRFDTLYVYAVDRLGREALWVLEAEHYLTTAGVKLQSATQSFDAAEVTGAFLLTLLAGQAQMEKAQIVGRLFHGATRCAEDGYWIGGRVPFGYQLVPAGKRKQLALCEEPFPGAAAWSPAQTVRWIFGRCGEDRATCQTIAHQLNALAVPTYWVPGSLYAASPQRSAWSPSRVRAILVCAAYSGTHCFGKVCKTDREPIRRACPALVTPEQFAACQQILTQNRNLSVRSRGRSYLLRGLIICGHCGRHYCGSGRFHQEPGQPEKGRYVYMCTGRSRHSPSLAYCRASHWIDADQLEGDVKAIIAHVIAHPADSLEELRERLGGEQDRSNQYRAEIGALEKQQQALTLQEQEYIRLRALGHIKNDAQLGLFLREVDDQQQALQDLILALHRKIAAGRQERGLLEASAMLLAQLQAAGAHPHTEADWRQFFETWVVRITVQTTGTGKRKVAAAEIVLRVPLAECATDTLTLSGRSSIRCWFGALPRRAGTRITITSAPTRTAW
jgi:site-specific DNA recombinase